MARKPATDKVYTIQATTLDQFTVWADFSVTHGFEAQSYQYNGGGNVVGMTATKGGREQHITPEIMADYMKMKSAS